MKIINNVLNIETESEFSIINITDKIKKIFSKNKIKSGLLNIYSRHTTLAIKINEDEELLRKDFKEFLDALTPDRIYNHDKLALRKNCLPNEPKNAKGHLRNLVLECSQTIPVGKGELMLGRFQEIFAIETSGPRSREIIVQVIGE
jgi:secondary thiamine-phosphate synthase enzyme